MHLHRDGSNSYLPCFMKAAVYVSDWNLLQSQDIVEYKQRYFSSIDDGGLADAAAFFDTTTKDMWWVAGAHPTFPAKNVSLRVSHN